MTLALRKRRALSMKWIEGGRELRDQRAPAARAGRVFEDAIRSAAKAQRALDKKHDGETLEWQQYAADALVTLADPATRKAPTAAAAGSVERSNVTRDRAPQRG